MRCFFSFVSVCLVYTHDYPCVISLFYFSHSYATAAIAMVDETKQSDENGMWDWEIAGCRKIRTFSYEISVFLLLVVVVVIIKAYSVVLD